MLAIEDDSASIKGQGKWVEVIKEIIKRLPMNKLTAGMVFVIICIILMAIFIPKIYIVNPAICITFMVMVFVYGIFFIYIEYKKTVPINQNKNPKE